MRSSLLWCVSVLGASLGWSAEVVLVTGDLLKGRVVERTTGQLVLEHPVLGTLKIPADQVRSVEPPVPVTPAPPPPKPKRWESQLEAGLTGARGNTSTTDARIAFLTTRKSDREHLKIDAAYYYGDSNHSSTKNKFTAGVLNDWLVPESPWLYFAQARYDWDRFQSWDHRLAAHGGAGCELIDRPDLKAKLRAGAGASKEWGSEDDDLRPEALVGGEISWQVSERQKLSANSTIYPDLGDAGEFRSLSAVNWTIDIDRAEGLSLKAGVEHEYQSQTDADVDNSDYRFFTALVLKF